MLPHYFIAGTDTDAGKTLVTCALLRLAAAKGFTSCGLKPIAAGCDNDEGAWKNADALALIDASTVSLPYSSVNPVALPLPMAPHIAAQQLGLSLSATQLAKQCEPFIESRNFTLVEGAGGWRVPLNADESMAGLVKALQLPVVLVVGLKLGCLNHALLTVEAIAGDGLRLSGWVASQTDPDMAVVQENLDTLKTMIDAPCLGFIPYESSITPERAARFLDIDKLLK